MRVPVEEAKLQELPQPRNHSAANKGVDVDARRDDGGRVGAAHPVDPLHRQHSLPAEIVAHPRDLDRGVALEVAAEVARVAGLERVVELLEQLLAKLVDDELGVAAQAAEGQGGHQPRDRPEDDEIGQDEGLDARALHLDRDVGAVVPEDGPVHLPQRRRRDRVFRDRLERRPQGPPELGFYDRERLVVGKRGHVVLKGAELVHVVLADDVGAGGEDLAGLYERGPQGDERAAELGGAGADDGGGRRGGLRAVAGEGRGRLGVRHGVARGRERGGGASSEDTAATSVAPQGPVPQRREGKGAQERRDLEGAARELPGADAVRA